MKKILYIDDEVSSRQLFNLSFKSDYQIFLANSALNGEEILEREEIPVIISDYTMPETNGIELSERLVEKDSKSIFISF